MNANTELQEGGEALERLDFAIYNCKRQHSPAIHRAGEGERLTRQSGSCREGRRLQTAHDSLFPFRGTLGRGRVLVAVRVCSRARPWT